MSQRYQNQQQFRPEIDYNGLVREALRIVIQLPMISDMASESQMGLSRSISKFSPERWDRAVRTLSRIIVKRVRDKEYQTALDTLKDPELLLEAVTELLDRNGFWEKPRRVAHL